MANYAKRVIGNDFPEDGRGIIQSAFLNVVRDLEEFLNSF